MSLGLYLQQLFVSIKKSNPLNIKIIENNISICVNVQSKRAEISDEDLIHYLMDSQLIDHRLPDGLGLKFINADDEDELDAIREDDDRVRLPGYSTIYCFLLEEREKDNCEPVIKETISKLIISINRLCERNKCAEKKKKQYSELE
jgi:hypothetical protein